jgi:hypothetical protein
MIEGHLVFRRFCVGQDFNGREEEKNNNMAVKAGEAGLY